MNDIWYLGEGFWMVYVDNLQAAGDFLSISAMQHVANYFDGRGKKMAEQFKFYQGDDLRPGFCLLHYVCRSLGLDFLKVLRLAKTKYTYGEINGSGYQPELFSLYDVYEPRRKKTRPHKAKTKTKS